MTIHIHKLAGCSPIPLAHYLKGLGILRLVSEQKDSAARGWWFDETFHLATTLDRDALERFFLEEYAPTPVIAPWNGGSGFYPKDKKTGIDAIDGSTSERLRAYREAIRQAREAIGERGEAVKDAAKAHLLRKLRFVLRGSALQALDAAVVISAEGDPKYPSLLGTGWNDGRLDFSNNFMQRIAELLLCDSEWKAAGKTTSECLANCLWGGAARAMQANKAIGQFLPGGAGGANSTTGVTADSSINSWDFVLMVEGAVVFTSALTRRTAASSPTEAAAPFAIHPSNCGYASASMVEKNTRGEQWMPLWEAPCALDELRAMMAEGRVQLGRRTAARPVDFARAVARLGVAHGIASFQRFGYLERNGQANLAIPLGRWRVEPQPNQELLDDLDRQAWMDRLQRATRDEQAPHSLATAHRAVAEAVMQVCSHGGESTRWQSLLLALAETELQLARSGPFTTKRRLQPIPPLSPGWLDAAHDESAEIRLATALALQSDDEYGNHSVRHHWLPLEKGGRRFATDTDRLRKDPRVVCHGLDPERDLVSMLQRRLVEGADAAATRLPLVAAPGFHASMADIAALLAGRVDLAKTVCLARALMALDRRELRKAQSRFGVTKGAGGDEPPPLYGLFRLAYLPWPLALGAAEIHIRCDPAILSRLAAGDLRGAGETAIRRLKAVGLAPVIRRVAGDAVLARKLAVSLAFPIRLKDATRLAGRLTKPQSQE